MSYISPTLIFCYLVTCKSYVIYLPRFNILLSYYMYILSHISLKYIENEFHMMLSEKKLKLDLKASKL